ncbi:MAG: glycosyltransferase family 87 protein [Desulfobaccales bacterium]
MHMEWLNQRRLTIYPRIIVAMYIILGGALIVAPAFWGPGGTDLYNRPLGADFSHYWVASSLALAGQAAMVYDPSKFIAAEEAKFKVKFPIPWLYPPTFLFIVLPLALLPYVPALIAWLAITLSGYLAVLRRIAPHPAAIWLALAFPGTFQNFFHGQNGFLSAALIGGGLLLVDNFPLAGGFLLGLASYKPQLAVLIPLALIAGKRWKALISLLAAVSVLVLSSLVLFGKDLWLLFFNNLSLPMKLLKTGALPVNKMVTFFSALLQFGGGLYLALFIQVCVMILVALAIFLVWHQNRPLSSRASVLVIGILLFTPYLFAYDLALLVLPLAWLGWEGYTQGWMPGEQVLLFLGWTMPFITPVLALIHLQIAPLILVAIMIMAVKRRMTGTSLPSEAANP